MSPVWAAGTQSLEPSAATSQVCIKWKLSQEPEPGMEPDFALQIERFS